MSKIAVICTLDGGPWGGSEELWAAMTRAALSDGHRVAVSAYDLRAGAPQFKALADLGAELHHRPYPRWHSLAYRARRVVSPPFQWIRSFEPDVVCVTQAMTFDAVSEFTTHVAPLTNAGRIPYVVISHYNDDQAFLSPIGREQASRFFNGAARTLFVSEENHKSAERQLAAPIPRVEIVRNPFNLDDTSIVPGPAAAPARLCSVARLSVRAKGQDLVLEALAAPQWTTRDWQLALYGKGPDRTYLEDLAHHYGIGARVRFEGHVADLRALWAENHLLVLASRGEGTPLALVEAMLCGRPAVVTDAGDNRHWIRDGWSGFVADGMTARSVGDALERAWKARGQWAEMGRHAHDDAVGRIDPDPGKTLLEALLSAVDQSNDETRR